jgi:hypothetical protein
MERNFFGLTTTDVKDMAFFLAIRNNLRHSFSETAECPVKK